MLLRSRNLRDRPRKQPLSVMIRSLTMSRSRKRGRWSRKPCKSENLWTMTPTRAQSKSLVKRTWTRRLRSTPVNNLNKLHQSLSKNVSPRHQKTSLCAEGSNVCKSSMTHQNLRKNQQSRSQRQKIIAQIRTTFQYAESRKEKLVRRTLIYPKNRQRWSSRSVTMPVQQSLRLLRKL